MVKRVPVRRWNEEQNDYVDTHENWPSAALSKSTGRWGVEGNGWRLSFDGDVAEKDARQICETIANSIQFELTAAPAHEKQSASIAPDGWDGH